MAQVFSAIARRSPASSHNTGIRGAESEADVDLGLASNASDLVVRYGSNLLYYTIL